MNVNFETDLSDFCSEFDGLESWRCLAFLKRHVQLHFTMLDKSRSLHFPRYASLVSLLNNTNAALSNNFAGLLVDLR